MRRPRHLLSLLPCAFLLPGCQSTQETVREGLAESPTVRLMRGEISADEYDEALTQANTEAREREQFEVNRDPTRAVNIRTGRVEAVPKGIQPWWNEAARRWEFDPAAVAGAEE